MSKHPRLAVSVGCPSGIGPEVSVAGAAEIVKEMDARVLLVGDLDALRAAARVVGVDPKRLIRCDDPVAAFATATRKLCVHQPTEPLALRDRELGAPSRAGGAAQLAWIDCATDLASRGIADALVTGPVSKDAIARSGGRIAARFRGHTEHLAARLRAPEVTMAFWSEELTTSLVTTHLPLAKVPRAITKDEVARAAYWTADFIARLDPRSKKRKPVAIAALNPHAGENGLLGNEEVRVIRPGIEAARRRLAKARIAIELTGPIPAESALRLGARGVFSAVVAMYHDQATIPMKLLGFGEAVNVSLGLPIIRTSVDHGTAYDAAGKGTAEASAMREAMELGATLQRRWHPAKSYRVTGAGRAASTRGT